MRGMGMDPDRMVQNMRAGIQQAKQAQHTPVTVHYFHCDHLGTPIALTDQEGNIVWAARHDPWGNIEEEYNPHNIEQNIRMPGQYCDRETGLYYNLHRYYDPRVGGYINQDPIGVAGGVNLYGYVFQNPMSLIDPLGLINLKIPGATGQNSIHANPGINAVPPGARGDHLPSHVHIGNNEGPRLSSDTFEPLSEKDKRLLTRQQQKFICKMGDEQKELIRLRQSQVYETGKFTDAPVINRGGGGGSANIFMDGSMRGNGFSPRIGPWGAEVEREMPPGGGHPGLNNLFYD